MFTKYRKEISHNNILSKSSGKVEENKSWKVGKTLIKPSSWFSVMSAMFFAASLVYFHHSVIIVLAPE